MKNLLDAVLTALYKIFNTFFEGISEYFFLWSVNETVMLTLVLILLNVIIYWGCNKYFKKYLLIFTILVIVEIIFFTLFYIRGSQINNLKIEGYEIASCLETYKNKNQTYPENLEVLYIECLSTHINIKNFKYQKLRDDYYAFFIYDKYIGFFPPKYVKDRKDFYFWVD